jgi:hypothetical protein
MWRIVGKALDPEFFAPWTPGEVLYEFDGPKTFTLKDRQGELCLAHWCDEDEKAARFLIVPTSPRLVARLKQGATSLREALDQPRLWIADVGHTGEVQGAWSIQEDDLPSDVLPAPGTKLLATLEREKVSGPAAGNTP